VLQGKDHYSHDYLGKGRLFSIAHQLDSVLSLRPASVLEVGVGTGVAAAALRAAGVLVTTLDLQPELKPDLVGSVTAIPAEAGAFDAALCCQVLEHLAFDQFVLALGELRRVTRLGLVLSLPDVTPHWDLAFALPGVRRKRISFSPAWFPKGPRPDKLSKLGHQWEIGYRGSTLPAVREAIGSAGWRIARSWRVPEKSWHRFFLLVP
jgi:ubiquinone/menaquinone biosynthesis C-methylase UbiE